VSSFDLLPTLYEQSYFLLSTDQRCESSGHSNIETPSGFTFLEDTVYVDGLSHTSECLGSQVLALKVALNESVGVRADEDRIGLRQALDAGSFIRDFTECQVLIPPLPTHLPHNDQPRMDAYPDTELDTLLSLQTGIEVSHGSEETQTRSYCSLGIVFVSLGIPKVHQETVSQELGDMSIKACNDFGTHLLICTHHITPVFRVELAGQLGRVHEVAEHDGELTAFRFGRMRGGGWRCAMCGLGVWRSGRLRWLCGDRGRWRARFPNPHQPSASFIDNLRRGEQDFVFQVVEIVVIEVKSSLEGTIRYPPLAFQEVDNLGEHLIKGHR